MGYTPPHLEVRQITGGYKVYPPTNTSGDDLQIAPNGTDAAPVIRLLALSTLDLMGQSSSYIRMFDGSTECLRFNYASPDMIITSTIANKNLSLLTTGTGQIKFGTYTAGAATDSTGYITILDAAGNTRKLMVQA